MAGKIFTALNKIQADTHWSNGRIQEAVDIYESILSSSEHITSDTRSTIEAKIDLLRTELDTTPPNQGRDIDTAIRRLQKAMTSDKSLTDLRKGVKKYYNSGLYADALENLKELIQQNAADEFCVTAVAACLIHLHTLEELATGTELFLTETFDTAEKAEFFKIMLADKMVKKGYVIHAELLRKHESRFSETATTELA